MSEEALDPPTVIPRATLAVYVCNSVLAFPEFLTVCYHVVDMDAALCGPLTHPAVYVPEQGMSPV